MHQKAIDLIIVGAGGAGLSAAIHAAEINPSIRIAVLSKVYPMRSHTVAAEGGAAAVKREDDDQNFHFQDTVIGGDWLSDQDAVEQFVAKAPTALLQTEHWGCPWSRQADGTVATRAFGGMKKERTWFAADKTGFHLLHTLFQTSLQHDSIEYFNEVYVVSLYSDGQRCYGALALDLATGLWLSFRAPAVILATGGAGQVFPFTTNAATNTGDGMALALRAGAPLKDMEFVQYHPTALPNTGILITEAARGEGGLLLNGSGYRYLQDYGLGPAEPSPRKKAMELGPRDKLSQAFWQEQQRGRTVKTGYGDCVHLDIRHLGAEVIDERLPMVRELSRLYLNLDPVKDLIPVRPAVHYTMGGIATNSQAQTPLQGLYAAGECACVSINGANRLGSNSLTELLVFGKIAAEQALEQLNTSIPQAPSDLYGAVEAQCQQQQSLILQHPVEGENIFKLKQRLHTIVDQGLGIYRTGEQLSKCQQQLQVLAADWQTVGIGDKTAIFNTELILVYELGCMIEVAKAMCAAALKRKESRGSHQRLDFPERDDEQFLQHSVVSRRLDERWLSVDFQPVTITRLPPGVRVYGGDS